RVERAATRARERAARITEPDAALAVQVRAVASLARVDRPVAAQRRIRAAAFVESAARFAAERAAGVRADRGANLSAQIGTVASFARIDLGVAAIAARAFVEIETIALTAERAADVAEARARRTAELGP